MKLFLHSLAFPVRTLGPGARVAVWTAGCSRNCPGCISPDLKSISSGRPVPIERLARRLTSIDLPLEGLTLSGGEPLEQAGAVTSLLNLLREARPAWNFMLYTGLIMEEIRMTAGGPELLMLVDLLVDGPYNREIPAVSPWAGSGNQVLHALSPKGRAMKTRASECPEEFEIGLGPHGRTRLIGTGAPRRRAAYHDCFEKRE